MGYSKTRTSDKTSGKFKKEFIVAFLVFGVVLAGTASEILEPVAKAGKFLAPKRPPRAEKLSYEEVKTHQESKGTVLNACLLLVPRSNHYLGLTHAAGRQCAFYQLG